MTDKMIGYLYPIEEEKNNITDVMKEEKTLQQIL